jgi:hypothetical protein
MSRAVGVQRAGALPHRFRLLYRKFFITSYVTCRRGAISWGTSWQIANSFFYVLFHVQEGCNELGHCLTDFACCSWDTTTRTWTHKTCTCKNGLLFTEVSYENACPICRQTSAPLMQASQIFTTVAQCPIVCIFSYHSGFAKSKRFSANSMSSCMKGFLVIAKDLKEVSRDNPTLWSRANF